MTSMLEQLDLVEYLVAVECLDVARLGRRKTTDRPAEVHEMRFHGMRERMHSDFLGQPISLAGITRTTSRDDVVPVVGTASRERDQMVTRESLA